MRLRACGPAGDTQSVQYVPGKDQSQHLSRHGLRISEVKVEIRYFGGLREKAGAKSETEEITKEESVGEVLERISRRRGIYEKIFGNPLEGIKPTIMVLVNGRNITFLKQMDTILRDGDSVSLIPPVGGG